VSVLREQGAAVSHALAAADSKVRDFQNAVERYSQSNYKAVQGVEDHCFTLARECILLLDHLDIVIGRARQNNEPLNYLSDARRRLCSLLETALIEEIPVTAGDVFDGAVHIPTSVVGGTGPEGIILGVSRKGYAMKVTGRSNVILRAAEVT
jgi:molecular chaperone GrpE (heat shock protein)